jgi:hypothetical protein
MQTGASLKCPSCGNLNEAGHRFCGLCGARVERRIAERRSGATEERAAAIANAQLPPPDVPARSQPAPARSAPALEPPEPEPPYSKPSTGIFRSEPAPVSSIAGPSFLGLSEDSRSQGQYLLDEEESSGGVLRKLVLIAILGAIAGLVFVQWRSGIWANPKAPEPPKIGAPVTAPASLPSPSGTPNESSGQASAQPSVGATSDAGKPSPSENSTVAGEEKDISKTAGPASAPRKPSAALQRAQDYLQGRGGVQQNCEQALSYLRVAAQANEPAAAVQMGALYATGRCVQRDPVMAYRWFNSAHELEPENAEIQANIDQLWGHMTAQERRQAGH